MALNRYIQQGVRTEQNLYEDLTIESLKIYGQDVYYLPRTLVGEDKILGEDVPSRFSNAYKIEMYIENVDGFDGEGDLFTKFGVEIRDQATFVLARKRWTHVVSGRDNEINGIRPREGDLIYLPLSKSMFEITHVEHEQPFYQLNNLVTFKLKAELFEYSDEDFDTSIDNIDIIEEQSFHYKLYIEHPQGATVILQSNGDRIVSATLSQGGNYKPSPALAPVVTPIPAPTPDSATAYGFPIFNDSGFLTGITFTGGTEGKFYDPTLGQISTGINYSAQEIYYPQFDYIITVADSSNGNPYFKIDGVKAPALSLTRGGTYTFQQYDSTNSGHPIAFQQYDSDTSTWSNYVYGVSDSGTPGTNGLTTFVVPDSANDSLRYYCTVHGAAMGNTMSVDSATLTTTNYAGSATFRIDSGGRIGSLISSTQISLGIPTSDPAGATFETFAAPTGRPDQFRAIVQVTYDSAEGTFTEAVLQAQGYYYPSNLVLGIDPTNIDTPYIGQNLRQVIDTSSNIIVKGEVVRYQSDSGELSLVHTGSNDGKFHKWLISTDTNRRLKDSAGNEYRLVNRPLIENMDQSEVEQNEEFDTFTDTFLDFSESNPFGDPS